MVLTIKLRYNNREFEAKLELEIEKDDEDYLFVKA